VDDRIVGQGAVWKTEPVVGVHSQAFIDRRMVEVHQWCQSDDARKSARRLLRKSGLSLDPEDLLGDTELAVIQAIRRRPENFETFNPAAYCMRTLDNAVKRLWARRGDLPVDPLDQSREWVAHTDEPALSSLGEVDVVHYLATVEALGAKPVHVSAAITVMYLHTHDDIAMDDAPWPQAGVSTSRRESWPALWIATRDAGLFPNPARRRPDGRARQRQRLLEEINALLAKVHLHIVTEVSR
jgi:hypothetical protein